MKPELNTSTVDIIKWFQLEFPDLVHGMKDSSHHYDFENLNPFHYEDDVWSHTMMVCLQARNIAPKNDIVRWSTILHDIGKIKAREEIVKNVDFGEMNDEEIYKKYEYLAEEFAAFNNESGEQS